MNDMRCIFLALLSATVLASCGGDAEQAGGRPDRTVNVVTHTLAMQPVVDEIQALGTAYANESVEIRPRVASLVTRVAFEEGQVVAANDLLVELENSEIRAQLAQAEAALTESMSVYNRNRELTATQAISESMLETMFAQVEVNRANVAVQKARLRNTYVRAPFAGRVGLRRISQGSFVNSSTVITTLDDIETIKLDFTVPETFITVLTDGMNIRASSIVYPEQVVAGKVNSIDTRVDPVSRAIRVRALIRNDDYALKPGMFMTVDLQRDRGDVLVAPEQAIIPEGTVQYVYVVSDGIVEKRAVELGRRIPGFVAVADGAAAGEIVIVEGTNKVRHGSVVKTTTSTGQAGG